jgi:sRNA-binding regulator protein Hfq
MSDSFAIPVSRDFEARSKAKAKVDSPEPSTLPSISPIGPRKLIRPTLPTNGGRSPSRLNGSSPAFSQQNRWNYSAAPGQSSHAEAFYFQKQIQSRTPMIFLLEDGERIEGVIEWYDRHSIKVRDGGLRILIYKASIKYLYKATESDRINGRP